MTDDEIPEESLASRVLWAFAIAAFLILGLMKTFGFELGPDRHPTPWESWEDQADDLRPGRGG